MMRFIKASTARKKYNIPYSLYKDLCRGAGSIAIKPGGKNGHYFFEIGELEKYLKAHGV